MDSKREKLESEFRLSIKQADDGSVDASSAHHCPKMLEAVHVFLTDWDALESDGISILGEECNAEVEEARSLPHIFLRDTYFRMLSKLNPVENVNIVRGKLLSTLRSLETASCRQIILDFLPSVSKNVVGSKNNNDIFADVNSKKVKKQILSCLKEVFENEPNSLSQILQCFSTILSNSLPRRQTIFPKDVFLFIIEILPKVPEVSLHIAIRALIHYIENAQDARIVVDSVRTELALLEKTDISDMSHVAITFYETIRGTNENEKLFVEEYFLVIEELLNELTKKKNRLRYTGHSHIREVEIQILTFDSLMVITLQECAIYYDKIMRMVSDGSLLESGLLSTAQVSKLVKLIKHNSTCKLETTRSWDKNDTIQCHCLSESFVKFFVTILIAPVHCEAKFDTERFFSEVRILLNHVIFEVPKDLQTKAISIALTIIDRLITESRNASSKSESKGRSKIIEEMRIKICVNIFLFLQSLTCKEKEILIQFQNCLVEYLISDSFDHLQSFDLLEALCTVVAKVICSNNVNGKLESTMICRVLLFSPSRFLKNATITSLTLEKSIRRQIRGMIFAKVIISCCDLDDMLIMTVQKMISRILLSPHTSIHFLDSRLGLYGMKVIRHLHESMKCKHNQGASLFQMVSLAMSHLRVVHYPNELLSDEPTANTFTLLDDNELSSSIPFNNNTFTRRKYRKMVFRFSDFQINENLLNEPSIWESSIFFIFELIDTYLVLGRTTKWNPRPWIFAGIEFPRVHSPKFTAATREKKLNSWLKAIICASGSSKNCSVNGSSTEKQIIELIKRTNSISEKEAIVDSISRFTFTLLSALSLSIAVLRNINEHYKNLIDAESVELKDDHGRQSKALQMIQYQCTKIYNLKHACESMERVFQNLGSRNHNSVQRRPRDRKKRRLGLAKEKTKIQNKVEIFALHLRKLLMRFFYTADYFPKEALWICLTDSSHDILITSAVENLKSSDTEEPMLRILKLRLNILIHLATATTNFISPCDDTKPILEESTTTFRRNIARCVRLISFLLLKFPSTIETNESTELTVRLTDLITEYLRLIRRILISAIDFDKNTERNKSDFNYILDLYLSMVGYKNSLNESCKGRFISNSFSVKDFNVLVSSLQEHISDHHTPITSQILEILSVFAARSSSGILQRLIDVHWNATFRSKYTNESKHNGTTGSPYILTELLKSLSHSNPQEYINTAGEECLMYHVISKLMKPRRTKIIERHQYLFYSMCRHWGLLVSSGKKLSSMTKLLHILLGKLLEYLRYTDDYLARQKGFAKEIDERSDDSSSDDDEYLPPTNSSLTYKLSIPMFSDFHCLTPHSYPVYLETLLRMTVSSTALISIPEEMSYFKQSSDTSCTFHPFYEVERIANVFGLLVKLYKDKFHIFPKCMLSSVVHTSKCMLDVSITKLQQFIDWRNSQPIVLANGANNRGFDLASTKFLKKFLDIFGLHVIGTLRRFCYTHSESEIRQNPRNFQVEKDYESCFGKLANPGLRSLGRKNERTFDFFSQTSNRYNLGELKTDCTVQQSIHQDPVCSLEGSSFRPEELSKTEQSTVITDSVDWYLNGQVRKKTENAKNPISIEKRSPDHSSLNVTDGNCGSLYSEESILDNEDGSSFSGSDGFGVYGNWGQDDDGSNKEQDFEFLIDRYEKSS